MWNILGKSILRFGMVLLVVLLALTSFFGWKASKVSLSYEFAKAIPVNNPKYKEYQEFRKKFGDDGNLMVIGIQAPELFQAPLFNQYHFLQKQLKQVRGVEDVVSVPSSINLVRKEDEEKLQATPVFRDAILSQAEIDSRASIFLSLPFYKGLLYNAETKTWLMGVRLNTA